MRVDVRKFLAGVVGLGVALLIWVFVPSLFGLPKSPLHRELDALLHPETESTPSAPPEPTSGSGAFRSMLAPQDRPMFEPLTSPTAPPAPSPEPGPPQRPSKRDSAARRYERSFEEFQQDFQRQQEA